jgi:hypothetical protein
MQTVGIRYRRHVGAFGVMIAGLILAASAGVSAQPVPAQTMPVPGAIEGVVTTQSGSLRLPGAAVALTEGARDVATQVTDADGGFRFEGLPAATYKVAVSLDGFDTKTLLIDVKAGQTANAAVDLSISAVAEHVDVVGATRQPLTDSEELKSDEMDQFVPGGGFEAALRLLSSVLEVPGGLSIKGGRASQSSVQLGSTTLIDPSTGFTKIVLPADALESVAVLPNPYAVEFGRFSSGVVVLQSRRAGDQWKTRINNFDPTFRTARDGNPFAVQGLASFGPRIETGGPLVPGRLFLEQTAQFQYSATNVNSLPENELRTERWISTFTRIDANMSPRHSLVASGGLYPRVAEEVNLGTFTPPETTVDLHTTVTHTGVTERALWTNTIVGETSVEMHQYHALDDPRGNAPMELLADAPWSRGNFFNRQDRHTSTYQAVETLSGSSNGPAGLNLYKFGFDLLHNDYEGSSASNSVLIRRADGTLARRLDFAGPTTQFVGSTDVALFAQDRIQPTNRWYVEVGGRLDRDGIIDRWNPTPRIGTAVVLNRSGSAVLRGGFGLFYDRTPSAAGVFGEFENGSDTRFAADGVTLLAPPMWVTHVVAPNLQTPRSATWDVAFDQRLSSAWSLELSAIDRNGRDELIVSPATTGPTTGELLLSSSGRSTYREAEIGLHYTRDHGVDVNLSYVRSSSYADLNALTNYFDTLLWPIVGRNQFAPSADVPNRLLARGRAMPTNRWLVLGVFEWRNGLPYSIVNEYLDYVGSRNDHRFPSYARAELGLERRFHILKLQPWIGVRVTNAFAAYLPTDVQANIASPAFGTFYNSEYRQFRIQVRFAR